MYDTQRVGKILADIDKYLAEIKYLNGTGFITTTYFVKNIR